jgi:hypothetical protein
MRLAKTAHTARPWRIHDIADDFDVEDVWELPTPGGPDDLDLLVRRFAVAGGEQETPRIVNALMAVRWWLGDLVGWDRPRFAVGARTRSLRERLPDDLPAVPLPERPSSLFRPIYQTHDEWAGEYADRILHAVLHLGWVPDGSGDGYHGQMVVLVKPTSWQGKAYMRGIRPFRWLVVYPSMLRSLGRNWSRPTAG